MKVAKVLRKAVKQFLPHNKTTLHTSVSQIPLGQGLLHGYHQATSKLKAKDKTD